VIDCSGTWGQPNPLGASGLPATGEAMRSARIRYGIPDALGRERARYAGRRTMVVGSGHSAANALLDLAQLAREVPGTRIDWAVRAAQDVQKAFGGGEADQLAARGALGAALRRLFDSGVARVHSGLRIAALQIKDGAVAVVGEDGAVVDGIDEIVAATGQRPDLAMTRELRLRHDPWLECAEALGPLIDPNLHSCGTVRPHGARELAHPEPGFYTAGVKSYGRAPTFLLATGYEQVRSIAAALTGDWVAASEVHLDLPQTGVCSATPLTVAIVGAVSGSAPASACCGPATAGAEAAPAVASCGGDSPTATKSCGASASGTAPVVGVATPASACCGTAPPTAEQCCDPVAKDEAIAAGASCCGPAKPGARIEANEAPVETSATSRPAMANAGAREPAA
jgi:hypothetical protein